MVIMELIDGVPTVTGGPVTSFDRYKVSEHLGTGLCGPGVFQGSPVWCRDSEMGVIKNWYTGKDITVKVEKKRKEKTDLVEHLGNLVIQAKVAEEVIELLQNYIDTR
jgi:hypothetical protein